MLRFATCNSLHAMRKAGLRCSAQASTSGKPAKPAARPWSFGRGTAVLCQQLAFRQSLQVAQPERKSWYAIKIPFTIFRDSFSGVKLLVLRVGAHNDHRNVGYVVGDWPQADLDATTVIRN